MKNKKMFSVNITYDELKKVIEDALYEFFDPDYNLEIRKEFEEVVKKSLDDKKNNELLSLEEVKKRIGL